MSHIAHVFDALSLFSVLWFIANLLTGVSYMHIPYELWRWFRGVNIAGMWGVAAMFIWFIVACGAHHLSMVRFVGHHPVDPVQIFIDMNMVLASVLASAALHHNRDQIRGVMQFISRCLANREAIERAMSDDDAAEL